MTSRRLFKFFKPPRGFKLTKAGRIFFAFLFAIIVVAMLTGNNLLFLILAFMLAFMIVSGLESERNIRYLEIERVLPSEIYARTPSRIGYHLRNTRLTSERLVISSLGGIKVACLPKGPGEIFTTDYAFERRGPQHLGSVEISTTFPYGLFKKSITFGLADDIVVFPAPLPVSSTAASLEPVRRPGSTPSTRLLPAGGSSSRFFRFWANTSMAASSACFFASSRSSTSMEGAIRRR